MHIPNAPASVTLLQIISAGLNLSENIYDPASTSYQKFKTILETNEPFASQPDYKNSPEIITYVQTLFLISLILHGGIMLSALQNITYKDNIITVEWGNNIRERFTYGTHDASFESFISYFQTKFFGASHKTTPLNKTTIETLQKLINSHHSLLVHTEKRIKRILTDKLEFKKLLESEIPEDILFIIIGCLPDEQINALFLHIQNYFPDNLEIKGPDGAKININILLQSPSTDTRYLLSKVRIYLELYFSNNLPIIKHITQDKTKTFLQKLTQAHAVFHTLGVNAEKIIDAQLTPRKDLLNLFVTHLAPLLPA
jgi:hypothetical protein